MKPLILIATGIVLLLAGTVQAQVVADVNIGSPPLWGPVGHSEVRYYYLPEVETFYDVQLSTFIYYSNGAWVHKTYLPGRYRSYDLYRGYKIAMTDYRGNTPYTHFTEYKTKYAKGYRGQEQKTIGERPKKRNFRIKTLFKGHSNNKISKDSVKRAGHHHDKDLKKNRDHKRSKG